MDGMRTEDEATIFSFKEILMRMPVLPRFAVRYWLALILLAIFLAAHPNRVSAQTDVDWNTLTNAANWNNPFNWSPERVPTGTDNAVVNNGGSPAISASTPAFTDLSIGGVGGGPGGTVIQSAGALGATGRLLMDTLATANCTYEILGNGTSANFTEALLAGTFGAGTSTLTIGASGGGLTIPTSSAGGNLGALLIGGGTGSTGSTPNTGTVNLQAGTLSVGADTAANQSIVVGVGGTNAAQLNVSGGTVNVVNSGDMIIGENSPGMVTQTGGAVNLFTGAGASSWLYVGGYVNAGTITTGTYTLSGGTLSDPNPMLIAYQAGSTGMFNLSGGSATIGQIGFGDGTGTFTLSGTGMLTVGRIGSHNGGTGVFNFNGGVLTPLANDAFFMANLATANIRNGGATINTNGFNITIAQPLVHSTIAGDNAIDGGLTKNLAGTLTLSGANTYTGATTINAGTLQAGAANVIAASSGLSMQGGTFDLNGYNQSVQGLTEGVVGSAVTNNAAGTTATLTLDINFSQQCGVPIQNGAGGTGIVAVNVVSNGSNEVLYGSNTYTGTTTVSSGSVLVAAGLNTIPRTSAVTVADGARLVLDANVNQNIGSLAGAGTVTGNGANGSGPVTLTVGNDNTWTTFGGIISDGGGVIVGVTKVGTGVLTLSGNNTFTGPLNVNGGGLVENGGGLVANVTNSAAFYYQGGTFAGRLTNLGSTFIEANFIAGNGMENDGTVSCDASNGANVYITLNGAGLNNAGTFSMQGMLSLGQGTNTNSGSLSLSSTSQLALGAGTLINSGGLYLNGAVVSGSTPGELLNSFGGAIYGPGTIESSFFNFGGLLSVAGGTTIISQPFTNSGTIQLDAGDLTSGAINNLGTINGQGNVASAVTNTASGTIEAIGGILTLGGTLANQAGGLLTTDAGAKLIVTQGLATNAGIINLTGGTFDNNGHPLNNTGEISGWGIFRSGGTGLDNNGSITFSGGLTTVNGPVTNEGGRTITVTQNNAIFTGLVTNNATANFNAVNAVATFAGGFANNGNSNFVKAGGGTVEIAAAPTLANNSTLSVTTGTLRFNVISGAPTIGTGVTAVVSAGATLELAGTVSALANGPNRVNIVNNSNAPGILVTGTNQQVGNIDGSGTTQVNSGSDLTANHIIQSALVIGGTSKNPGLVTIDASDASGNPVASVAVTGVLIPNIPLGVEANLTDPLGLSTSNDPTATLSPPLGSSPTAAPVAVPEPSSLILFLVGCLAVGGASVRRRRCGPHTVKGFSCSARSPT